MWSLSLVMSECSLSGRGQGHVGNFYIVNLENFATASRWYTGDIHNTTVVGLFMIPIRQWKWLACITVECTCLLHIGTPYPSNFITSTCRTALLHGSLQDFNWHDALCGPSAIAELLVILATPTISTSDQTKHKSHFHTKDSLTSLNDNDI